jgi:YgiT-type zinc finger domain-containing protein
VSYSANGDKLLDVLVNVSDETEVLLIGVPCEVCEHCGVLAFKAEKG